MEEVKIISHPDGDQLQRRGIINLTLPENNRFVEVLGTEFDQSSIYWVEYNRKGGEKPNIAFAFRSKLHPDPRSFKVGGLYYYPNNEKNHDEGFQLLISGINFGYVVNHDQSMQAIILQAIEIACAQPHPMSMFVPQDITRESNHAPFFLRDWVIQNCHTSQLMAGASYVFSSMKDGGEHPALTEKAMYAYLGREIRLTKVWNVDSNWLLNHATEQDKHLVAAICYAHSQYVKTGLIGQLDVMLDEFENRYLEWKR
jgi:hypothetical protein